jgi:hypothetical protein
VITAVLDPCDGSEERFNSITVSLDNDGDDLYDMNDPDCQPAAPMISVSPTSKDYGNVQVGNSSSQVFTISNGGTADLVVSAMNLSDTVNFSLDTTAAGDPNACGSATPTIAASDNCTVSVAFSPTLVAAFSETFSIASNDAGNPTLNVSLGGTGVAVPTPTISVSPTSIDYGQVVVGSSSSRVVTVFNTGSGNLIVSGMTLSDTVNFSLDTGGGTNPCGSATPTITGGDNCTVSVAFSPPALASFGETFSIASNDTANPTVIVPLTGIGVAAAPDIAVSPASIDYGNVSVGSTATREVTVSNAGTADLNVSGIILSDNTVIHTLDLGGGANPCVTTATITTPPLDGAQAGTTSTGTGSATITYDEATNLLSWDITYSGLSGPPTVAHFHGPAVPGVSAGVQVPITVTASPLIGSATITDEQEADLLAGLYYVNIHTALNPGGEIRGQVTAPVTIAAGDNCTVAVTFIPPSAGGPFPATLTINSDDSDSPSTVVPITGMGRTPSSGGGSSGCAVVNRGAGIAAGIGPYVLLVLVGLGLVFRRRRGPKGRG